MSISDLPVVRAIREKMRFHGERQKVLAENIANATTPGYQGRDLRTPDFFRVAADAGLDGGLLPVRTSPAHLPGRPITNAGHLRAQGANGYEVTPDGNGVVLEEQMMKVADNQMEYQMATSLYQRGLGLLRTAVSRR